MIRINLLPKRPQVSRYLSIGSLVLVVIALFIQLIFGFLNYQVTQKLNLYQPLLETTRYQNMYHSIILQEQNLDQKVNQLEQDLLKINRKISILDQGRWNFSRSFEQLTADLPEKIWLTRIEHRELGQLLIQGKSLDYNQILLWFEDLNQNSDFTNVQPIDLKGEGINEFTVKIDVGGKR